MKSAFTISADALGQLAKDLNLGAEVLQRAEYRAINKVANKAMTTSRRKIVSAVNLTQKYVKERMSLSPATKDRAVAVIMARPRHTRLATYAAKQITASAPRARGDSLRGIPAGRKQAGVSVSVKRGGGRKKLRGAFMIPLRAGTRDGGNGMGIFIRTGSKRNMRSVVKQEIYTGRGSRKSGAVESGDIRHLYGPSVYQVFRGVIPEITPGIADDLEKAVADQTEYEIRKALKL